MLRSITFFIVLVVGITKSFGNPDNHDDKPFLREFTEEEMRMSEEAGYSYVDRLTQLEEDLFAQGQYIKEDSPFYRMSQFKKPQPEAQELSRKALLMLEAARFLKTHLANDEGVEMGLRQLPIGPTTNKPKTSPKEISSPRPPTFGPSTPRPSTARSSPPRPSTAGSSPPRPPTAGPNTPRPSTVGSSPPRPSTAGSSPPRPPTAGPSTPRPSTVGSSPPRPSTAGSSPPRPSTAGPSTPRPSTVGQSTSRPATVVLTTIKPTAIGSTTTSPSSSNSTCLTVTTCPTTSKYRKIDGSCNSLTLTNLGKSFTDYRRLSSPAYADGIQSPRVASNGSVLTSARLVSTVIFGAADRPVTSATLALMQFGQFINHDFQSTTQFTFSNGSDISCCSSTGGTLDPSQLHPACLPVSVPTDDRFWNNNNPATIVTCMNFVRSISGPRLDCSIGYADQLNQNTHWMDASTIYGSTPATSVSLRNFTNGLLKTTKDALSSTASRDLLPVTSPCTTGACFFAGDSRVTEQPQLTVMHTLWHREHNRVAKALAVVNPTWNDTILFEEARRIVIAEMQHITYNEFIPSLLSPGTITKYSLAPLASGFLTNANTSRVSTGPVSNEFATAAFRFGHSLVQGSVQLYAENGTLLPSSYTMSDTFNDASRLVNDKTYLDAVIRGLLTQPSQSVDQNVDDSLWNRLFRVKNIRFDIVSLNIQRGRDHGIPSYNTYRQLCGFPKAASFADLSVPSTTNPVIKPDLIPRLQQVYNSVDDIDVYVAGLLEAPLGGSIAGPILNCLLGEQFNQIKFADRYFYELGGQAHSFSTAQLTEIRKTSLARIFCDNSDGTVLSVQSKAFIPVSTTNAKVPCIGTTIPSLNLTMWKNEALF